MHKRNIYFHKSFALMPTIANSYNVVWSEKNFRRCPRRAAQKMRRLDLWTHVGDPLGEMAQGTRNQVLRNVAQQATVVDEDNVDSKLEQQATAKLLQLYGRGTKDLRIVPMPDGQGAFAVVLGRVFATMAVRENAVQFYSKDCLRRIEFPLTDVKGCHTFALDRFIGQGEPFDSGDENWEFDDFVLVKE